MEQQDASHRLHAHVPGYRKGPETPQLIPHRSTIRLLQCPTRIIPGLEFSRKTSVDVATITTANLTGFRQSPSRQTYLVNDYE
jgi:hypothetical protein